MHVFQIVDMVGKQWWRWLCAAVQMLLPEAVEGIVLNVVQAVDGAYFTIHVVVELFRQSLRLVGFLDREQVLRLRGAQLRLRLLILAVQQRRLQRAGVERGRPVSTDRRRGDVCFHRIQLVHKVDAFGGRLRGHRGRVMQMLSLTQLRGGRHG